MSNDAVLAPGGGIEDAVDQTQETQDALRAQGYGAPNPGAVRELDAKTAYNQEGHKLEALGIGALSGLTAGLSDIALSQTGYAEELANIHKYQGGLADIGQIAGGTVGAFATGPLGAVERALAAPGHAIGRALTGTLGNRAAGSLGFALEGAAFGAVGSVGDQMARGETLSSEQIWNAVALGGVIGGGLGGLMAKPVPSTAKAYNRLADLARGAEMSDDFFEVMGKSHRTAGALQTDSQVQKYVDLTRKGTAGGVFDEPVSFAGYRAAKRVDDMGVELGTKYIEYVPELLDTAKEVGVRGQRAIKTDVANDFISKMPKERLEYVLADVDSRMATLEASFVDSTGAPSAALRTEVDGQILPNRVALDLGQSISDRRREIRRLMNSGDLVGATQKAYESLDFYSKKFGDTFDKLDTAMLGKRSAHKSAEGIEFRRTVTDMTNKTMVDPKLWGDDMATIVSQSNRLAAEEIDAATRVKKWFLDKDGDPKAALRSFFEGRGANAGYREVDAKFKSFRDLIESRKQYLTFLEEQGQGVGIDLQKEIGKLDELADDIEKIRAARHYQSSLSEIRKAEHESVGSGHLTGIIGALGGAINVPLGFALSTAGRFGTSPTQSLATAFQITEALAKRSGKWDGALKTTASKAVESSKPLVATAKDALGPERKVGATIQKLQLLGRGGQEDFDDRYDSLAGLQGEDFSPDIWHRMGKDPDFLPAAKQASQVGHTAIEYLLQQAPSKAEGRVTAFSEKAKFQAAFDGLLEPYGVLEQLNKGNLDFRKGQAIKAVYPKEWEHMQSKVVEIAADLRSQGKTLNRRQRIQLGLAFDLKLDPRLNVTYMETMTEGIQTEEGDVPDIHSKFENTSEVVGTRMEHDGKS